MKQHHFLLPVRLLPLLDNIEENPPPITGFNLSRLKYLITLIISHKKENRRFSYSVLNMEIMSNIIPKATYYLRFLKELGIIEWKEYSAGRNSRLYRVARSFDGEVVFRTITDQNLIRRIESGIRKFRYQNSKKYPKLNQYVLMVELDTDAAYRTIEETYQDMRTSPEKEVRDKADSHRSYSLGEVDKIISKQIYIKVNTTNYRYDTNFTRLPSELVKHLHINGTHFKELDIVNSQPFFSSGLFNPTIEIQKFMSSSLIMLAKSLYTSNKEDINEYVSLVTSGHIYDFLMNKFKENSLRFIDRKDFKEMLFAVYFDKNRAAVYSRAVRLFETTFPNVWLLFKHIKKYHYNRLAILLQKIESHTMLNHVASRIVDEFPGIPFLTKHDSILVPVNLAEDTFEQIQMLIENTVENVIGYRPKLKVK